MSVQGLIFDMDGVLFDTEGRYIEKRRLFFAQEQIAYDEKVLTEIMGLNLKECLRRIFPEADEIFLEDLKQRYEEFSYEREDFYQTSIFPEVEHTLAALCRQGYEMGLASSSPPYKIEKALKSTKLEKFFSFSLSGNEFQSSKPDPAIYLEAVSRMSCRKEEIMVIEDSEYGIRAAKAAGLLVTGRREYRYPARQEGCDYYIDTLAELPELLKRLEGY